ncbi:Thiopurine S-methyltransferase [Fasciolopsis buskii]|uniref:Thiopurine S-methyltransferase n=1 Tax=Fasciolopsis buskii TaxID=27845 RepID=A0A8E0VF90_9TREM|nr:Thiopurine S-methyltransferase [Fasciolopsis buski]
MSLSFAFLLYRRLVKYWDEFCPPDFRFHRVFVPLCGKSVDLGWMSTSKKCTVVGCDLAEVAVIEFVREHADLSFRKSTVKFPNGEDVVMYHTLDNNLRIYVCDLFSMESAPEDPFNLIWDRGSFVAISPSLRTRYVALMSKLSTPDVRWLQETLNYPPGLHRGPPCSISSDEFSALYGKLLELLSFRVGEQKNRFTAYWKYPSFNNMVDKCIFCEIPRAVS